MAKTNKSKNPAPQPPDIRIEKFLVKAKSRRANPKDEDSYLFFDEIVRHLDPNNYGFVPLFEAFVNSFGGMFDALNGKAISVSSKSVRYDSGSRTISGIVQCGHTDMGGFAKKKNEPEEEGVKLTPDHVSGQPYYFLFYLPETSKTGVLIFQSFSDRSFSDRFRSKFQFFVAQQNGPVLTFEHYFPERAVSLFKEEGHLSRLSIRRYGVSSDRASQIMDEGVRPTGTFNVEIRITGKDWLSRLQDNLGLSSLFGGNKSVDLGEFFTFEEAQVFGIDEEPEVVLEFERNGRKSTVTSESGFKFEPNFYLTPGEVERDEQFIPKLESIDAYCRDYLAYLKSKIPHING